MTVREQEKILETYQGLARTPGDFAPFWREHWARATPCGEVRMEQVPYQNPAADYALLTFPVPGGRTLRARYIRPSGGGRFPTVLMFHDLGRGVRGWHHMTRFIALGYAVAALENQTSVTDWRAGLEELDLEERYTDALALAHTVSGLPHTDPDRLCTWGEGFGGGLAVVTAALLPDGGKCAALNPMPADLRSVCGASFSMADYLDPVSFAPMLKGPLLLGTGLLDRTAPPDGQYTIFNRAACPKTHLIYPKYEHERINAFENELLKFLSF